MKRCSRYTSLFLGGMLAVVLVGCATPPPPPVETPIERPQIPKRKLSPEEQLSLIEAESRHLGLLIKQNRLTKTQAANQLNQKRLMIVGSNPLDDEVFAYYRGIAVLLDKGHLDSTSARKRMERRLKEVQRRIKNGLAHQKDVPVFTRFMMKIYEQPSL